MRHRDTGVFIVFQRLIRPLNNGVAKLGLSKT
jgi:hypothetical protein